MFVIGENIAALRKKRGITQEQLGQLVGVSAQAVSKWEKGGMPDAELLPVIAECLGVTIDSLYGFELRETEDISVSVQRYLAALPTQRRMNALFRLVAQCFSLGLFGASNLPTKSAYVSDSQDPEGADLWMRSLLNTDEGLMCGVLAEDMPLFLLMPEPPAGYAAHLAELEDYRELFEVLAMPGALELLDALHERRQAKCSAGALSKSAGLSAEVTEQALQALEHMNLITQTQIELEEGNIRCYSLGDNHGYLPLLYMARWLMDERQSWNFHWDTRELPLLRTKEDLNEENEGNNTGR